MRTLLHKMTALVVVMSLLCTVQVESAPVSGHLAGLVHRAKRSLLWRWNTLKAVQASCREHSECATKYCRRNVCSFRVPSV